MRTTLSFLEFGLGGRREIFNPLLGNGIFTQDGTAWKHSRELLRPQFQRNRPQAYDDIQRHVENLLACIPDDEPIDLQPLFFKCTLDITSSFLFQRSLDAVEAQNNAGEQSFAEAFAVAQDYLARRGLLGLHYWLIGGKEFREACKTVHDFVNGIIAETLEAVPERSSSTEENSYAFLRLLMQETRDPVVLRDQLLNVLLAGRDTTACLLSWTW